MTTTIAVAVNVGLVCPWGKQGICQERERPVSLSRPTPPSNTNTSNATQSTTNSNPTGWLQFEKCPVFAIESVELPSQESGAISSLDIQINEMVKANQILGKLDTRIAELEKTAAGLQAQVANAESNDDSELRLAKAFLEEAEIQLEQAEEMSRRGTLGTTELRQKQLAVSQAEVRVTQSKALRSQKELKAKLAQSSLFLAQQKLDRLALRSPINGTVTRIDHRPGEWVQAGTPILKIVRLNELRVDCFINSDQISPSKLNQLPVKVLVRRGAEESIYAGKVTSYDPEVSAAGLIRIHASIQNQMIGEHWQVLPGMSVIMQVANPLK